MRPHQQLPCIRVAPDGTAVCEFRAPPDAVALWQEFNKRRRPDHALVVGAEVVWLGSHFKSGEDVAKALQNFKRPKSELEGQTRHG